MRHNGAGGHRGASSAKREEENKHLGQELGGVEAVESLPAIDFAGRRSLVIQEQKGTVSHHSEEEKKQVGEKLNTGTGTVTPMGSGAEPPRHKILSTHCVLRKPANLHHSHDMSFLLLLSFTALETLAGETTPKAPSFSKKKGKGGICDS